MNEYTNNINIESLKDSFETISSIDDCLKNVDISKYFVEIENIIRKVNFEHGNCMIDYKNDVNLIYEKIEEMKSNIDSLKNALLTTVQSFSGTEEVELRKETSFANQLETATTDITRIPPVTTQETVQQPTQTEDNTINTVPIGLGIAAAGITGSIGAVVLDSMKSKKSHPLKESDLEEYQEPVEEYTQQSEPQRVEATDQIFDDSPYHASRNETTMNKFYGTDITEYYEKEDEDNTSS